MAKKLNLVDMYGIGLMLEHLVAEGNITCEERDRVILRIARENDIAEYMLSNLAGYGRSKQEVLERAKRRKGLESQGKKQEEGYISLTEVARAHSEDRGDIPAMVFAAKKGTADQSQIDHIIQHYFRILRTSFENLALMMLRQFPPSSSKHMDLYMKHKMMKYPMWRAS